MLTNEEKISIIDKKILYLQQIYNANLININNPDSITSESDYDLETCFIIKKDLEIKLNILNNQKSFLENQETNGII